MYEDPDAYYKALNDPNSKAMAVDSLKAFTTSFLNTYGNGDRYEEFAVGFLTGVLGAPTFGKTMNNNSLTYIGRGRFIGLTGGIGGEIADADR